MLKDKRFFSSPRKAFFNSTLGARTSPGGELFAQGGAFNEIIGQLASGYWGMGTAFPRFYKNPFGRGPTNSRGMVRFGDYLVFAGRWPRGGVGGGQANSQHIVFYDLINGGWFDPAPGTTTIDRITSIVVGSSGDKLFITCSPRVTAQTFDGVTIQYGAYYDGAAWHNWSPTTLSANGFITYWNELIVGPDDIFGGEVLTVNPTEGAGPFYADTSAIALCFNEDPGAGDYFIGAAGLRLLADSGALYFSGNGGVSTSTDYAQGILKYTFGGVPTAWSGFGAINGHPDFNVLASTGIWTRPVLWGGNIMAGTFTSAATVTRTNTDWSTSSGLTDRIYPVDPSTGFVVPSAQMAYPDKYLYDLTTWGGDLYALGATETLFPTVITGKIRRWNAGTSAWDIVFQMPVGQRATDFHHIDTTI